MSQATEPLDDHELATLGLRDPFILRTGGFTKRKNVALLLEAWPEVHRRTVAQLALAGPPQAARAKHLAAAPSLGGVVVVVRAPFVEEVCADDAVLVDPDPAVLVEALVRTLDDEPLRARLTAAAVSRATAFTRPAAADALVDVYREQELAAA